MCNALQTSFATRHSKPQYLYTRIHFHRSKISRNEAANSSHDATGILTKVPQVSPVQCTVIFFIDERYTSNRTMAVPTNSSGVHQFPEVTPKHRNVLSFVTWITLGELSRSLCSIEGTLESELYRTRGRIFCSSSLEN